MKVIFAKFPTGKVTKFLLWLVMLILLIGALSFLRPGPSSITKEEVLKAVYNTEQSQNYRWHIVSEIEFKGVRNPLSDVNGERNKDAFKIKGNFLKTPLEIIQFENMTYRLDNITKQWLVLKNQDAATEEILTTELNPVAPLNFTAVADFPNQEITLKEPDDAFKVKLTPQVTSPYLTKFWQDFQYTLWVDKDRKYLKGYELNAKSKKDPTGTVHMKVEFSSFEKVNIIEPPL